MMETDTEFQPLVGEYRKVSTRFWNDEKVANLQPPGATIFLRVLLHQNLTSLGAMKSNVPMLASEFGIGQRKFKACFQELQDNGMIVYDDKYSLIWLPNYLKYNFPNGPNAVKHWLRAREKLPECPLLRRIMADAKRRIERRSPALIRAFKVTFPELYEDESSLRTREQKTTKAEVCNLKPNRKNEHISNSIQDGIQDDILNGILDDTQDDNQDDSQDAVSIKHISKEIQIKDTIHPSLGLLLNKEKVGNVLGGWAEDEKQ